jgi:hypothetical protein
MSIDLFNFGALVEESQGERERRQQRKNGFPDLRSVCPAPPDTIEQRRLDAALREFNMRVFDAMRQREINDPNYRLKCELELQETRIKEMREKEFYADEY